MDSKQLLNPIGELCALAGPVGNAVALEIHSRRFGARIVEADHLDRPAVARAVLLDHDNTIIRLLASAEARDKSSTLCLRPFPKRLEPVQATLWEYVLDLEPAPRGC